MPGDKRNLSNVGFNGRIKQMLILVIAILVGVIISCAADAQDFQKAKKRHFLTKYKSQLSHGNSCHILSKKRNAKHRLPLFASWHRKPKYQTQAEVDPPATVHTPKFRRTDRLMATN